MDNYRVLIHRLAEWQENPSTQAYPDDFERFLFNEPIHLRSQPGANALIFRLLYSPSGRIKARFSLFIQPPVGTSPSRAPFGGIEFAPQLDVQALDYFLDQIEEFACASQLESLHIKAYPFCYAPDQSALLTQRLMNRGFAISQSDVNFHLPITPAPFEAAIHPSEKRRLRKCIRANFSFTHEQHPDLAFVYSFVKASRKRRGHPISMAEADFTNLFQLFPEAMQVFTVKDQEMVAALTVAIVVNPHILYNFYPADADQYQTYSPTVLLTQGLYQYCQQKGFSLLDLGISTDQGIPNPGLILFKQKLGAHASLKLSFEKKLEA